MKKIILATLGMGLLAVGFNASAANDTDTMNLSFELKAACTVDASGVSGVFGSEFAGSTAQPTLTGGNITVSCPTSSYLIGANHGNNSTGGTTRNLNDGTNSIPYTLSLDNTLWGDANLTGVTTVLLEDAVTFTGAVGGDTHAITGTLTSALTGSETVGSYTDIVTVTIEF